MISVSILALLATLPAGQRTGRKIDPFTVRGSDGRQYTLESLTAAKPVLLFYLDLAYKNTKVDKVSGLILAQKLVGFEKPDRTGDLNLLMAMTKGKLRVVALCFAKPPEMQWLRNHHNAKFLMIGDDKPYSAIGLQNQLLIPDIGGMGQSGLSSLQNTLIFPDGRRGKVWPGLSRGFLSEMQADVRKYAGTSLHLNLTRFPRRIQAGQLGMFGVPH